MLFDTFIAGYFKPNDEHKVKILEDLKSIRAINGVPENEQYLLMLEKTRQFT